MAAFLNSNDILWLGKHMHGLSFPKTKSWWELDWDNIKGMLGFIKFEEKCEEKWKKIKNRFKFDKLFLYVFSNLFYLFLSTITRLNNLKYINFKLILIIFNFLLYIFFYNRTKHEKTIFLNIFFLFLTFLGIKHNLRDRVEWHELQSMYVNTILLVGIAWLVGTTCYNMWWHTHVDSKRVFSVGALMGSKSCWRLKRNFLSYRVFF